MEKILEAYKNLEEDYEDVLNQEGIKESEKEFTSKSLIKIRNLPHLEGNFSAFIYVIIENSKNIKSRKEKIKQILYASVKNCLFEEIKDDNGKYHISLSTNFYLKYHEIDNFLNSFIKEFNYTKKQKLIISEKVKYLTNEFKTRYFLSLEILKNKSLRNLYNKIKNILEEFNIEVFYEVNLTLFTKF